MSVYYVEYLHNNKTNMFEHVMFQKKLAKLTLHYKYCKSFIHYTVSLVFKTERENHVHKFLFQTNHRLPDEKSSLE